MEKMSPNIKDSSHFIRKLNNITVQQNDMVSFDDVSLLTNVPLEDYIKVQGDFTRRNICSIPADFNVHILHYLYTGV